MKIDFMVWVGYFFLMFLRISAIFTLTPVFGRKNMPRIAKIGLSLLLTYISISVFPPIDNVHYNNLIEYVLACMKELSIGLIIGLITTVFFSAAVTAGQFIDMQIGFGFSQMFEIQSGNQVSVTSNLLQIILIICFFLADGHLMLIKLVCTTFESIPVGKAVLNPELMFIFVKIFILSFVIGIKIAMPIFAAAMLAEVILGIMMRSVPQMNFFVVGIPLKLSCGLVIIFMFIPLFVNITGSIFEIMYSAIEKTFEGMVL